MKEQLKVLNFAQGIRSSEVNSNFKTIEGWINKERKRVAGHGLVEGFNLLSDLEHFTITVESGVFINELGREIAVEGKTFTVGKPDVINKTMTIDCPKDGIIRLPMRPYSPSAAGYIQYKPPTTDARPRETELKIVAEESSARVPIIQVAENRIYVNAKDWAGKKITISYIVTKNRIDAVFLTQHGELIYEKGIMSDNPSHVLLKNYQDHYVIGTCLWEIGEKIKVTFDYSHRTYRNLYVDNSNHLWICGRKYEKPKWILFEKPEHPEENDIWYNKKTNILYIYKQRFDKYDWYPINENSTALIRQNHIFVPDEDFPSDKQTFLFPKDAVDLKYIPGQNSLEIIIDNARLMSDQFEEITAPIPHSSEGRKEGIGFKLVNPLDRATHVEVVVHHPTQASMENGSLQRASIYVTEETINYTAAHGNVFETRAPYVTNQGQLEIYLDGKKLARNMDYREMVRMDNFSNYEDVTDRSIVEPSFFFRLLVPVSQNQKITYRINRHVWSYDQLNLFLKDLINDLETTKALSQKVASDYEKNTALISEWDVLMARFKNQVNAVNGMINEAIRSAKAELATLSNIKELEQKVQLNSTELETVKGTSITQGMTLDELRSTIRSLQQECQRLDSLIMDNSNLYALSKSLTEKIKTDLAEAKADYAKQIKTSFEQFEPNKFKIGNGGLNVKGNSEFLGTANFQSIVTAITQNITDNSNKIATTKFVNDFVADALTKLNLGAEIEKYKNETKVFYNFNEEEGYVRFGKNVGGLMICFGQFYTTREGTIYFPVSFPHKVIAMTRCLMDVHGWENKVFFREYGYTNIKQNSFWAHAVSPNCKNMYIAIGY